MVKMENKITYIITKSVATFWGIITHDKYPELPEGTVRSKDRGILKFPNGSQIKYIGSAHGLRGLHDAEIEIWAPYPDWLLKEENKELVNRARGRNGN